MRVLSSNLCINPPIVRSLFTRVVSFHPPLEPPEPPEPENGATPLGRFRQTGPDGGINPILPPPNKDGITLMATKSIVHPATFVKTNPQSGIMHSLVCTSPVI